MKRPWATAVSVTAAALVLTGVGVAAHTAQDGTGAPGPSAAATEPTAEQTRLLDRAEQVLISECMTEHGFAYDVTEPPDTQARSFPYVVDDIAWAREHGYGGAEERRLERVREADPNQRRLRSLPADRQEAARATLIGASPVGLSAKAPTGTTITASDQGCVASAQRALYGDLAAWFRVKVITMNLRPLRETQVREDARYTRAVERWAACMREAGRPYPTPDHTRRAAADFAARLPAKEADAAAASLAAAEAACATSTGLARVAQDLDRSYREELRTEYRDELQLRWRFQNDALPRARRVTAPHTATSTAHKDTSGGSHA
ncbi:hypothetical protein JJV70_04670 [Streptomyces sp. JJ66]|uniref:hypothetical protein n=1 Tax=Streptomyces sp. JJ66 TaxID=2803843 RepID=UPI001C56CFB9|nr:hypothetical protein [Streptomyces sp. JJ66]MBW1601410.1 hypothetical protein [Streptomyces sp. JJ66]